jgi:hypothetical protein
LVAKIAVSASEKKAQVRKRRKRITMRKKVGMD